MKIQFIVIKSLLILLLLSCNKDENPVGMELPRYTVSGRVVDTSGVGLAGVPIFYSATEFVLSDNQGYWAVAGLQGARTLTPTSTGFSFAPSEIEVNTTTEGLVFERNRVLNTTEIQIFNWFNGQQLPNGLLESVENGNVVSLYDNALAAMVFMLEGDFAKAEKIFDFFNGRINTELNNGVGGFAQLRDRNGTPNNHRWMGDNAWLLIALNNYKHRTGKGTYDNLAVELGDWLMRLQDTDGGLFAGYNASGNLMNHKVTEGNIDAFNAIDGYTTFHSKMLDFLENDRWVAAQKSLVAWPTNPPYLYALDLHPWSYLIFDNFPHETLTAADRFLTTQIATNGAQITGYCFDDDKDTVWPEGTGQMAVAFGIAGMNGRKSVYLTELEKIRIQSTKYANAAGFPYASNMGTAYSTDALWTGADTKIAISGGAWYLFAKANFNPFAVGRNKNIPTADMFWLD